MARLDSFLELVFAQKASDLHFCAGTAPTIRHDGELMKLPFRQLSDTEARRFLYEILNPAQRQRFDRDMELDFVYSLPGVGRFRANYFIQSRGIGAVFRVIPNSTPSLADLELPPSLNRLIQHNNGLVLVTGPTGSGKTTTLAAMVNEINQTQQRHVLTIEDPVEYVFKPASSLVTQRQVGVHVESFSAALRSALREAPDVIVVGEMRDLETIQLAINAAETGSLVLGTLHTNTAATAIDRIIDSTPEESRDQIRATLSVLVKGIVAQHLIRRSTGEGRIAVCEVLLHNHAIAHMIREDKVYQIDSLLASADGRQDGSLGLDVCLYQFLRMGLVDMEEALRVAKSPENLRKLASQIVEE
ncbi:MAG: PilT/PilU family type 4a pilus ATPase [Deltaproteobacteria bacterium]|nr:MAG: PilT/PilU family type 4a pilus ATPase [Deltaproteobacteria bacterium]